MAATKKAGSATRKTSAKKASKTHSDPPQKDSTISAGDLSVSQLEVLLAKKRAEQVEKVEQSDDPVFFARNLRQIPVSFRLSRQDKPGAKRTNLKPRGQRGDVAKLQKEDLSDTSLREQINYGLIEIISEVDAQQVIDKQTTNTQFKVHPARDKIRNENGNPYKDEDIKIVQEQASQGVVVGSVDDKGHTVRGPGETPQTETGLAGLNVTLAPTQTP